MSCNVNDYKCADRGLLMPFVNEYTWNEGVRAFIYLVGLLWSFMGVSIIADIFMEAIEQITSKKQKIKIYDPKSETDFSEIEVLVWNGTVANLTLMALGSSAPEILLSVIEIVGNNFMSGDLGPGTIVGSAAFNLFVITAICIMAVPSDVPAKSIKTIKVFVVTATFSVWAYIWLILILVVISPDYVELWEAMITLLMFPLMVILSYLADRNFCGKREDVSGSHLDLSLTGEKLKGALIHGEKLPEGIKADKRLALEFVRKLKHERNYTDQDVAKMASYIMNKEESHSRSWYRRKAIRDLTGSQKMEPVLDEHTKELLDTMLLSENTDMGSSVSLNPVPTDTTISIIEFAAPSAAVLEKDGRVKLNIMRLGNQKQRVLVHVATRDGTAEAESDYVPVKKTIVFEPNQTSQELEIDIIDDNIWEPDEVFFVVLSIDPDQKARIGNRSICQVVILNDDEPGTVQFEKPSFLFKESVGVARVPVKRINGADGKLTMSWKTHDSNDGFSAVCGKDYDPASGEVVFDHGEVEKHIDITIHDDMEFEKDENFEIEIVKVSEGAKIGKLPKTVITIVNDDEFNSFVSRIADLTNANLDALRMQRSTWAEKFKEAMNVNGGDIDNATMFDYVMHFFTFGWKFIFAFVPPSTIWGGWLCFFVALFAIGLLTAIIGDLAGIFGCLVGLEDAITAITFVALGTSLPDTFASKSAAQNEKTADNSIGNITGSNGVNVFLGLGLPWTIAAIYWSVKNKSFEVPAGDLGFSVTIFTICAVVTIAILMLRRYLTSIFGGELGGRKTPKILSGIFLIFIWILYVLLASLQTYGHISGF